MLIGQRKREGEKRERRESITFQLLKSKNFCRWIRNQGIHSCYGNAILVKEPLTIKKHKKCPGSVITIHTTTQGAKDQQHNDSHLLTVIIQTHICTRTAAI